jgi:hypothetical protein
MVWMQSPAAVLKTVLTVTILVVGHGAPLPVAHRAVVLLAQAILEEPPE